MSGSYASHSPRLYFYWCEKDRHSADGVGRALAVLADIMSGSYASPRPYFYWCEKDRHSADGVDRALEMVLVQSVVQLIRTIEGLVSSLQLLKYLHLASGEISCIHVLAITSTRQALKEARFLAGCPQQGPESKF
jgi:hypothetical protein